MSGIGVLSVTDIIGDLVLSVVESVHPKSCTISGLNFNLDFLIFGSIGGICFIMASAGKTYFTSEICTVWR